MINSIDKCNEIEYSRKVQIFLNETLRAMHPLTFTVAIRVQILHEYLLTRDKLMLAPGKQKINNMVQLSVYL